MVVRACVVEPWKMLRFQLLNRIGVFPRVLQAPLLGRFELWHGGEQMADGVGCKEDAEFGLWLSHPMHPCVLATAGLLSTYVSTYPLSTLGASAVLT